LHHAKKIPASRRAIHGPFPVRPAVYGGLTAASVVLIASFTRLHLLASALDQWLKPGLRSLVNEAAEIGLGWHEPAVNGGPDEKKPGKPGCESGKAHQQNWHVGLVLSAPFS
jgi:hypothetical protein